MLAARSTSGYNVLCKPSRCGYRHAPCLGKQRGRQLGSPTGSDSQGVGRALATTPYDMEEEVARARITAALVLAAAASLALSACEARTDQGGSAGNEPQADAPAEPANAHKPEGDGNAKSSNVAIAYAGTINGENAALGQNILNGVKLAVKKHNDANKDCQVELKEFETEGVPEKAPGIVTQMVNTKEIVGVVGLPFSGESKAAGNIFDKAGLP